MLRNKSTYNFLLQKALDQAFSYNDFRDFVSELAKANTHTGTPKTESLAQYTRLNDKRMARWDKTLNVDPITISKITSPDYKVTWLVLTESWCGDAAPSLPVMHQLATALPWLAFRIILRDQHPALMDQFLTNGSRSIPKLIALREDTQEVVGTWGPRGAQATAMVKTQKEQYGKLTPEFKQELQVFYNKDKGQDILNDLVALLLSLK
ncbi:MAG: thioredoxin family protein [Bacteroidota bacterium]